jgi:hypothetical protein
MNDGARENDDNCNNDNPSKTVTPPEYLLFCFRIGLGPLTVVARTQSYVTRVRAPAGVEVISRTRIYTYWKKPIYVITDRLWQNM